MTKSKTEVMIAEGVTLRVGLMTLLCALVGISLISLANAKLSSFPVIMRITESVGGLLFGTVAIAFFWNLWGQRAFLAEILAKVRVSDEVNEAGITRYFESFQQADWRQFLMDTRQLDIYFIHGRTWRNQYLQELRKLANKNGASIRVILPDYEDAELMREICKWLGKTSDELVKLIQEAEKDFIALRGAENCIQVWRVKEVPRFSCYRFDNMAVIALNSHQKNRPPVPTVVCKKGGSLFNFIVAEIAAVTETPLARRIV